LIRSETDLAISLIQIRNVEVKLGGALNWKHQWLKVMSNTLAIAAVTAMLKDILENQLANHVVATSIGDLLVTALPPDRITVGSDERSQLNIFLYQVSQNRNADWIGYERLEEYQSNRKLENICQSEQPPLALDLHYLITAYGAKDFQAELLLGYAMQVLHDIPLITREMVYTALKHAAAMTTFGALSQVLTTVPLDDLVDQIGAIKLCSEFFSMEETSKLWSSLQTHYRPSAGYQASMVLLNRRVPEKANPPLVISQPTIEQVESLSQGRIQAGDTLMIRGQQLQGEFTYLRINGRSALLSPQAVADQQITLLLPPDLPAGIQSIQVVHLNKPQDIEVQEIQSNRVAFAVQPAILVHVASIKSLKPNLYQAQLILPVRPLINSRQQVLFLFHATPNLSPVQINVPLDDTPSDTLTVSIQVAAGRYEAQIQVDGVRSEAVEVEVSGG
jgi:hypothetical protein